MRDESTRDRLAQAVAATLVAAALGACATRPNRAPIEERTPTPRAMVQPAPTLTGTPAAPPAGLEPARMPGSENAGKPGYYTVRPGDTLIRIGLDNGQSWRDLVRWNGLENPNLVEVGQVLRVVPPGTDGTLATTRPVTTAKVETRPLDAKPLPAAPVLPPPSVGLSAAQPAASAPHPPVVAAAGAAVATPAPAASRDADDDITWGWPVAALAPAPYNEAKAKGLVFQGKAGEPVLAAADGRVVYAGSGLRGYGNLVILKHNNSYLTAYAHNQTLLVKEEQQVRRGQKIAEMGSTDAEGVQLHFEIRKQGKPIDPSKLLPPR